MATNDQTTKRTILTSVTDDKTPVPKKVLTALEKVFAAEMNGLLPFQSKASIYRDLLAAGLVSWASRSIGSGWSAVMVSGYDMTHRGRMLYCASCKDEPDA